MYAYAYNSVCMHAYDVECMSTHTFNTHAHIHNTHCHVHTNIYNKSFAHTTHTHAYK